jgi:hypothetical protein
MFRQYYGGLNLFLQNFLGSEIYRLSQLSNNGRQNGKMKEIMMPWHEIQLPKTFSHFYAEKFGGLK